MAKKQNKEDNRLLLGTVRMPDVSNPSRDEVFKRRSAVSDDWEPSKELLDAIKSYEKFSPVVYKDGNGIETIGYGITDKKIIAKYRGGKRMSKKEAERLFNRHVDDVIAQMKDSIPNFSAMSNNQKDAMTSYVYNVGIGGVTRKSPKLMEALENKNWKEAAKQMDFGYNDKNNSGLRRRRDEERALFTAYLDMGLEEPTEEELAAAHARMHQNALEDILSSRNELELQDPLRTKFDEAYRVAMERKQPTFTWNGREYATDLKSDGGPVAPRDAIQPPANPTMDFMNLIGESIPYDAGTLPDINIIMDLSPEEYRDAMRKAAARRGRNYVYQAQEEAAPLIQGLAGAAAAASLVSAGLFQPTMNFAADFMSMLENPLDPVNYLPYSDVFKITKKTNSYDEIEKMIENRKNVKDEYSESVRKFFKNVLVPEYERIIERRKDELSENGKKLLESRLNGKNYLNFVEEADKLGINDDEFGDIQKSAMMQLNVDLIKKEIEKPDAFNYNIGWTRRGSMGEYDQYSDEVNLSKIAEAAGFDTKFSTLVHEFRHKMDSKGINRKTADDILRRFSLSENEIKTLEDAYVPAGRTKDSDDLSEIISTNTDLKLRIIRNAPRNRQTHVVLEPEEILGMYNVSEKRFREILDNTSDEDLLDMLESVSDYGMDYASSIRSMKDDSFKRNAINAIRKAVSTIPFSVVSMNQAINLMNDKSVREEDMIQGGDPMTIEMINNVVYNNLKDEMRDGGSFSDYLSKVDGDNLIDKLSKTNYYGKKRANLFKLARMGNKEAYNVLIDDFKEKLLEIDRKQNKNKSYKEGGEIDEDLSPNEGMYIASRDAIQPPTNPTMDFMNSIGETVPFYAGELPEIVSSVNLSPEDYRNAMLRAAARRGRSYVYQSQSEAAPLMSGLAASAGLAAFASLGLTSQIPDAALSIFDLLEDPTNPLNYLPFSDLAKVAKHRSIKIPEGFGEKSGTEKMIKDNSDYAKEFYLNVLMPIYEDGTNRSIEKLSDSGKRLYDKIKSENGKNVLDVINDVGASWQDEKDVEFILRREAMAENIKDDLKNKDIPIDVVDDPEHPNLPNYDYETGRISIPSWFNMLGNDEMRRTLIHEMRHMFTESPQQIHRANADVISNFLIGWDEKKKIDNAYKVIGNPETKGSLSRYEKLATNTEIKQILLDDNYFDENMNYRGVGSGSEFGSGHIDPSSNEKINERLDKISDDTLLDILENTNSYGRDYARHIRAESDPSERKIYMDRIRDAVKNIPLFYFPITDPMLNEAGPNQDTIIYGNETYGPRISNEKSAKMANEEVMKNGGTVKNYINSLSDNDLLSLYSKTSDYGKKRSYMLYLAKGRDKEVYDILIKDMRESIIKEGEKYDTDRMDDDGYYSDEEENLSPNEAILRRIANDLSSRNMLAENAAYYSGKDEITAEELANYIGKMSPHRFVMSIGSDDDELNDFSTRLTTGVLDGDEQAIEDAETLRRMMLETPFNNSNITIMRDGGNMLPGLEDTYMTPELLEYEQGGEAVKDRQMYVYKRLKEEAHMDDLQALAVIGNLMGESGLNPYLYGDQDTAYGIQQWRGERRDRLNKLAREKGEETPSFETQVDYLINEYLAKPGKNGFIYNDKGKMGSGYYNYSLRDFQNASTLRDATVAWNLGSGRPHKDYMRNDERYQFAKQAANNLGIELDEPDANYYSDNGIVQNGFSAPSMNLAQNDTSKETDSSGSSTVKIEEGNIPDRSASKPSEEMTEFQESVINELLIQRGLIMGEQARQQEEAEAQRADEERQARINEEARRNAIIQSVLQNAKLDIPGMASR